MKIGIFSDTYTPYINGVTTSIVMLKNALEKKGHTVYIVTVNNENINNPMQGTNVRPERLILVGIKKFITLSIK